jgi:hypothetical protein
MSYTINFTDKRKTPIIIDDTDIDTSTDIALFGRNRLTYGEQLQENLLHILENFSCPEDPLFPGNPDLSKASNNAFQHITIGQGWYNSTNSTLYYYDGTYWMPLAAEQSIAANWGIIADGQYLPNPVSAITGQIFSYVHCVYIVSPQTFPQTIDYMICKADANGLVTMKYRISGTDSIIGGVANYLIVGIAGNINQPAPTVAVTLTPTPTPTSSSGTSHTPTPTITPSTTPVSTTTPTPTPTTSVGTSITPVPSVTPTRIPISSVTPTPTTSAAPLSPLAFQGQSIHAFTDVPPRCPGVAGAATIQCIFNADGTYSINTTSNQFGQDRTPNQSGIWLPAGWSSSDTSIKFTDVVNFISEANPASVTNSAPAYQPLAATQLYTLSTSGGCTAGTGMGSNITLTISLKRISTGVFFNTTCTLDCESSDAGL